MTINNTNKSLWDELLYSEFTSGVFLEKQRILNMIIEDLKAYAKTVIQPFVFITVLIEKYEKMKNG